MTGVMGVGIVARSSTFQTTFSPKAGTVSNPGSGFPAVAAAPAGRSCCSCWLAGGWAFADHGSGEAGFNIMCRTSGARLMQWHAHSRDVGPEGGGRGGRGKKRNVKEVGDMMQIEGKAGWTRRQRQKTKGPVDAVACPVHGGGPGGEGQGARRRGARRKGPATRRRLQLGKQAKEAPAQVGKSARPTIPIILALNCHWYALHLAPSLNLPGSN